MTTTSSWAAVGSTTSYPTNLDLLTSPMLRRNVLIFHLGALGDFILTWPLVLALSRIHPQSRIICVTHRQKGQLAEETLRVDSTDIENGWHHLFADSASLPAGPAKLLANAHSIYSFIAAPTDPWAQNVRQLAPEADLFCLDSRPVNPNQHATEQVMAQLATRPAVLESCRQMLRSVLSQGIRRRPNPGDLIVVHPGSGSPEKCWPANHFLDLIRSLRDMDRRVRVLLGDVEIDRWPPSLIDQFRQLAEVACPKTLTELLADISDAASYVGNDSGPSHLAAIIGLPTLCIFGPTNPAVWRPLGPLVTVLQRTPLSSLTPDELIACLRRRNPSE